MKVKVGIDLVEIDRMETAIHSSERFLQRVLGPRERDYYESHGMKTESLAAAFAAKEAFSKALGTGVRDFSLNEVEVLHDSQIRKKFLRKLLSRFERMKFPLSA